MRRRVPQNIKIGTPLMRTVRAPYDKEGTDYYVPGWDAQPGMMQHAKRISMAEPGRTAAQRDSDHPPVTSNHPKV